MKIRVSEIRQLPEQEIQKRIVDEEINLANLKFQKSIGQLESPIKIRTSRRLIAKYKTILREIQILNQLGKNITSEKI